MSLVNNMLRDLDQRRKVTSVSSSTVNLTPVSDASDQRNVRQLLQLIVIVALLAVAVGYYYFKVTQNRSAPETLNLRPAVANTEADVRNSSATANDAALEVEVLDTADLDPENPDREEEPGLQAVTTTQPAVPQGDASGVAPPPAGSTPASGSQADLQAQRIETPLVAVPTVSGRSSQGDSLALAANANVAPVQESADGPAGLAISKSTQELSSPERDAQNVQNALALYNTNQINAAFTVLSRYLETNRDAHQTRETYAKLLMSQGALSEASAVIDDGLMIAPNRSGYKKMKARLLMADNQYAQAATLLINRAPVLAEDMEYHDMLATAQLAGRDYSNALATYTNLIRYNQNEGKWWYGIAVAYDGLNQPNSALQAYTQALQTPNLSGSLRQRSQRRISELRQ